ncbi:CRISPR-associated helicase Cas3' [Streptomyces phaeochromogenes]|uniref:CRISPR-associated helicase Cas3' n=1 Tax=Streptomyces phaeochromogenes TaxID=1923 RepID=UPI00386BA681|nr:CRISPR-associated helicase Cas3' [Streptomyces phaeochromogenes]
MGVREDARRDGIIDLTPWGKFDRGQGAVYSLLFHLLDVAAFAGVVWDRYLTRGQRRLIAAGLGLTLAEARCVVMFIAGLHDLGKLSAFQEQEAHPWARVSDTLRADTRNWRRMPHERASMHSALHLLAEAGYPADTSDSPGVLVAQILGGHHGRFLQVDIDGAAKASRVNLTLGGPAWQDLRRRYFALLRHLTGASAVPAEVSVPAAVLITGVGIIADRLASQRHYWLPRAQAPAFGAGEHFAQAVRDAPAVFEESGLARITLAEVPFTQAHGGLERPNALQASVLGQLTAAVGEKGPGILVVTDATGGGKSVTALEAARIFNTGGDTAGIAWLLPSTATADAAYEVLEWYVAAHGPERAPVSLVHSHSWLNSAYTDHQVAAHEALTTDEFWPDGPDGGQDDPDGAERPEERVTVPDGWLRGWDRALLAQFTVATHDQALMAALPVRFSALRLLALSGRIVIVDEAHALTPFMQQLLGRLLHWLGALGCPVVLLSATLPACISTELVRNYLAGAGHPHSSTAGLDCAPDYPGWLFAAAADACVTRMDPQAGAAHAERHRRTAALQLYPVRHSSHTDPDHAPVRETRLERIGAEITPVVRGGGCAAVVCATMADAQAAYRHLHDTLDWPGGPDGQLLLLHARLPGHQREALTRLVRDRLGPVGDRPARLVVVTTSLLDMSLDIDVDVMVSDLASLEKLLQRLGRLWRFENLWGPGSGRRPTWVRQPEHPRLSILQPTDHQGRTLIPAAWRTLEPAFFTHATATHLARRPERTLTLTLPDDVQHLVESVHGDAADLARTEPALEQRHTAYQSRRRSEEHLSALHLIPTWRDTLSLADLHRQRLHAREAATRLGAMPRRLLPIYRTPQGRLALDAAGTQLLPLDREPTTAMIRTILQHTLPVPAAWVADRRREHHAPALWKKHALLADLVLLPHDAADPDAAVRFGRHTLRLDTVLGLVHGED